MYRIALKRYGKKQGKLLENVIRQPAVIGPSGFVREGTRGVYLQYTNDQGQVVQILVQDAHTLSGLIAEAQAALAEIMKEKQ